MASKGQKAVDEELVVSGLTRHRTCLAPLAPSEPFLRPPIDPAGRRVDCSDRLLICASSNMRNEVVVGGSDHALYSINVSDPRSKHVTMYGKTMGHTDWVTTVTHLANGKVLSGAMDGKLCLWSERVRSQCVELQNNSMHPISKVISDLRFNVAMSCSYDGSIAVWNFGEDAAEAKPERGSSVRSGVARTAGVAQPRAQMPISYLAGHTEPVLECGYRGDVFVSGDKSGALIIWDLEHCKAKTRFRAHPGPITAVDCAEDRSTFISCGTDGFVKIWDPRTAGSGLVHKIPAHVQAAPAPAPVGGASRGVMVPAGRGGRTTGSAGRGSASAASRGGAMVSSGRGSASAAAPTPAGGAGAISCMAVTSSRGSSTDMCYIVTGSGSPSDSSLAVIDVRQGFKPVSRWEHHRNGVYSLCVAGDECILSGDGMGTLLCHNLLASEFDYPRNCLKYGIGASEQGAVRSIQCLNGKVVTAGEDGKVMIFDYDAGMFAT